MSAPALNRQDDAVALAVETIEVSIVMPCLNEVRTVGRCVAKAVHALEDMGISGEVIVADNGSTDGSAAVASEHGARVVPVPQKGYGAALQAGIAGARGRYVIMGDADDSYDFSRIEGFVEKLRAGDELVMGNRFKGGIQPGAMPPLHRYFGNPLLSALLKLFFGSPIGDCQSGLRAFRKDAYERLKLNTPGMEFASEMVVKSCLNGLKISEVPIQLHPDGRGRPPHLRSFRDGWRNLRLMLLLCPLWLYYIPAGSLLGVGLFLMLWLSPGTQAIGRVKLDVHSMLLGTLCVLLGYQTLWLGFLAKVYGHFSGVLPSGSFIRGLLKHATLERGLITGLAVTAAGIGALLWLVGEWIHTDLGPLEISYTMRFALWGLTAMVIGVQTIYSSFFLSMLRMTR